MLASGPLPIDQVDEDLFAYAEDVELSLGQPVGSADRFAWRRPMGELADDPDVVHVLNPEAGADWRAQRHDGRGASVDRC